MVNLVNKKSSLLSTFYNELLVFSNKWYHALWLQGSDHGADDLDGSDEGDVILKEGRASIVVEAVAEGCPLAEWYELSEAAEHHRRRAALIAGVTM